jgi:sulfate permease, SulP family
MATEAADRLHHAWPIFRSLASFRPSDLPGDLIAGLTLAAIAIPEQMATARLGGFSPQIGFFAFIAGSVGFAMFGGNGLPLSTDILEGRWHGSTLPEAGQARRGDA